MPERYEVIAKVISQKGTCTNEHKVGDEWVIGAKTPEGMCFSACHTLSPYIRVLMFGGVIEIDNQPDMDILLVTRAMRDQDTSLSV